MLVSVLSGFVLAIFAPMIFRIARSLTGWLLSLLPLGITIYLITFAPQIADGEVITQSYPWVPSFGINLSFYLDGLSLLMALLISGIGTLIFIYAGGYLHHDPNLGKFYLYLSWFMASMLGVVLADDIITLFIFWELTSISSYLLIGYKHEEEESRYAATQALLVTGGGGLVMLAGLILLQAIGGSWELSALLSQGDVIQASPLYSLTLILLLIGAFTKSAQMPFHFWLPGAMAAPTPVSAYLHSATMVKAGVYLLARLNPILGGTGIWTFSLTLFGGLTALLAAYIAWQQTDLKRILAFSTVSALGMLVMLLGQDSHVAAEAALLFLLVHSLYKGGLFMVAGIIDHETGTRDIRQLGGLARTLPITLIAGGLAALSMSGIPPFLGFLGKELIYEATLETHALAILVTGLAVLTNILTILAAGLVILKPFFGPTLETPKRPHRAPLNMWLGPAILGGLSLAAGVLGSLVSQLFISPGASAILGESVQVKLSLWHGFTPMLVLSAITIGGGIGLYFIYANLIKAIRPLEPIMAWGSERWYRLGLQGLDWLAIRLTKLLQNGYMRYYILFVLLTLVVGVGFTLLREVGLPSFPLLQEIYANTEIHELLIPALMVIATLIAISARSRLTAVAATGVVGFNMSLIFVYFGAPDLAITEFAVDTLSVILLVLVLYRLPRYIAFTKAGERIRDAFVAITSGLLLTTLVLIAQNTDTESRLAGYFAQNTYKLAKGENIVNVILVDFRGVDTMGEITVLAVAAIGVYTLLKFRSNTKNQPAQVNTDHKEGE